MIQSMRFMCREYTEIARDIKILYFPCVGFRPAIWIRYALAFGNMPVSRARGMVKSLLNPAAGHLQIGKMGYNEIV